MASVDVIMNGQFVIPDGELEFLIGGAFLNLVLLGLMLNVCHECLCHIFIAP